MKNKLIKKLKSRLGALKARLGQIRQAAPARVLIALLAAAAVLTAGVTVAKPELLRAKKNYDLVLLALTPMGYLPVGHLLVADVSHEADGSICFQNLQTEKHMCLKFDTYDLTEAEVK